jgi:hypothetical protein
VLCSATGRAQDGIGEDQVVLKNGGTVRGTVVSSEPGVKVKVIELGEKEARVIPWEEVEGVERGKFTAKAKPAEEKKAESKPEKEAPSGPGVVKLHIESDNPEAQLFIDHGSSSSQVGNVLVTLSVNQLLCRAPCDETIDVRRGQRLYFAGPRITESSRFNLADRSGSMTANLHAGSRGANYGGAVLGGAGLGGILVGAVVLAIDAARPADSPCTDCSKTGLGVGLIVGGAVGLAAGILIVLNTRTTYELTQTGSELHPKGSGFRFTGNGFVS